MNWRDGYWKVGTWRGIPFRVHWTTALGALIFGQFAFVPVFWLAFIVLVVVHEVGHAMVVRRLGYRVMAVELPGFGGLCRWAGSPSRGERAAVAWGGVVAQLVLLAVTVLGAAIVGPPRTSIGWQLYGAFTSTNLMIAGLNLLPFAPLDGAEAWGLVRALRSPSERANLLRRLLPRKPRLRFKKPLPAKPAEHVSQPAQEPRPANPSAKELGDFFRKIADDASRARRGE